MSDSVIRCCVSGEDLTDGTAFYAKGRYWSYENAPPVLRDHWPDAEIRMLHIMAVLGHCREAFRDAKRWEKVCKEVGELMYGRSMIGRLFDPEPSPLHEPRKALAGYLRDWADGIPDKDHKRWLGEAAALLEGKGENSGSV